MPPDLSIEQPPGDAGSCPLCGESNDCAAASRGGSGEPCWCEDARFGSALLARVPPAMRGVSCICAGCAADPEGRVDFPPRFE